MTYPYESKIADKYELRVLRSYDTDILELRLAPEELSWLIKLITTMTEEIPGVAESLVEDLVSFRNHHWPDY